MVKDDPYRPTLEGLYFLPLGGAGEIGMNLSLYGHAGKWLMVDLGVTFADETTPGVDIVLPDAGFIAERRADLVGLVLTHAHEDHLGAVPYLWPTLQCPIYTTAFTAAVLKFKLQERGLNSQVPIHLVTPGIPFTLAPFTLELIRVTHSIPEPSCLVIRTDAGTVLHTGDWKLDPKPVVGETTDDAALRRLGEEGILALVGDSTNALEPGHSGSEGSLRESLTALFGRYSGRIAVTCFASNVARLESIAAAAAAHDRRAALVGRSLWRIYEAARGCGYLSHLPEFLTEHQATFLPRDKVVLICTGSQGEKRSALARIAIDDHPEISLDSGDVVIFSSREIPGNEKSIGQMQNHLVRRGIEIVTSNEEFVHVSGHPARDELIQMYQWVRPRLAVAVHGEQRHQMAHARLARDCQVPNAVVPTDGEMLRLAPGPAEVVARVKVGKLAVDGKRIVPFDRGPVKSRQRIMHNGAVVVTLVLSGKGDLVAPPQVAAIGLLDVETDHDLLLDVVDAVREAVGTLPRVARIDDEVVRQAVTVATRRSFKNSHGKKPLTEVHLVRVPG